MSRLPFLFIVTGIIGFVVYQAASLTTMFGFLGDSIRGPEGWFHVHLFVLGWATMLAMGAVYQLIHVILQSPIYSERLGYAHYMAFMIGLIGLLYGFVKGDIHFISVFATLAFIGILLFAWNMAVTLLQASKWNAITLSAACSVLYLVLTGVSGMAMGINFATGWFADYHENLFGAHIWMGTVGWFGLLITGFSYKMLPMFYLAHDYPTRPQNAVVLLWKAAVAVGSLSFLVGGSVWFKWFALLLLTAASVVYNVHLLQIKKKRHKRTPGSGIQWSLYCSQAFACSLICALIYTAIFPDRLLSGETILVAGWTYLGGWVSFTILSYASKIVPFLWWTHKYGKRAGKPGTPMMADLLSDAKVNAGLTAIAASSLLLLAALTFGSQTFVTIAGAVLAAFSVAYIAIIGLVFAR